MRKLVIKLLWCGIFLALTIYPPIELSRVITQYGISLDLAFELAIFWVLYAGAIFLVSWLVFKRRLLGIDN